MKKPNASILLKHLILAKEIEQEAEGKALKEHFKLTYRNLRPLNLIKNAFKEAISGPEVKTTAVNAVIGRATGYVAKKVLIGATLNPFTNIIATVLETVIANKVANNADGLKSLGSSILYKLINKITQKKNNGH